MFRIIDRMRTVCYLSPHVNPLKYPTSQCYNLSPMSHTVSPALPLEDYLNLPVNNTPWIIEPLIPVGGIINLYGRPKLGKSFMAIDLARAIANGEDEWLEFKI